MKFRFFSILLISLSAVGFCLSIAFSYYLNAERIELIDVQLREIAAALVNSELADIKKISFPEAQELISEELGSKRVGKLFIIRNDKGQIVFKSGNASLINLDPPQSPQTYNYKINGRSLRILNLHLPKKSDRTLQIGALFDPILFDWSFISNKLFFYLAAILLLIFIFSVFLTNYLLSPLKIMARHLKLASDDLQNLKPVPELPKQLIRYTKHSIFNNDEFSGLVDSTSNLLERININYKMTKPWTYQLAHEIKTPLSILTFDVESLCEEELKNKTLIPSMNQQIERISNTVSQFLEWASVENTQQKDNLFAIRIAHSTENLIEGLERIYPGRINYIMNEDFIVIANPQHFQQLLTNVLTNALHYSPESSTVTVKTFNNTLLISDNGNGIPDEVLARIGQPFNCGPQNIAHKHNRTGLGLAWINTLTKLYQWNLHIESNESGTTIIIKFAKTLTN